MAKILMKVRQRLTCAHCGALGVFEFEDDETAANAAPRTSFLSRAALGHGWVNLGDTRMFLCPKHAETIKAATVEEVQALGLRCQAFALARRYGLSFVVIGERLIADNDERRATAAEVALWQVIAGAGTRPPGEGRP